MTCKFMRKLVVVMIDLIILIIIIEVQANELSSTFFHHSSLPISLRPLELDNNHVTLYNCHETKFKDCEEKQLGWDTPVPFATCILLSSGFCASKYPDDPMFEIYRHEFILCVQKHYHSDVGIAKCLYKWHKSLKKN